MSIFKWTKTETPDGLLISFSGKLDDEADLGEIDVGSSKRVTLDLSQIRLINSLGIRQWILWSEEKLKGREVRLRACPKVIIDQANIVKSFIPKDAVIESIYAPYFCEACEETTDILLENEKNFRMATAQALESLTLPTPPACPTCGKPMEIDVDEARYFRFLKPRT